MTSVADGWLQRRNDTASWRRFTHLGRWLSRRWLVVVRCGRSQARHLANTCTTGTQ